MNHVQTPTWSRRAGPRRELSRVTKITVPNKQKQNRRPCRAPEAGAPGLSEHLGPESRKGWVRRPRGQRGRKTSQVCSPLSGNQQTQSVPHTTTLTLSPRSPGHRGLDGPQSYLESMFSDKTAAGICPHQTGHRHSPHKPDPKMGQSSPLKHRWTGLKGGRHAGAHPRAHIHVHTHTLTCTHICTQSHAHMLMHAPAQCPITPAHTAQAHTNYQIMYGLQAGQVLALELVTTEGSSLLHS